MENNIRQSLSKEVGFIDNTELQNKKVMKLLITLWFYVYECQRKDNEIFNFQGYTEINTKKLEKFKMIINKKKFQYAFFLNMLLEAETININKKYSQGNFCKSYRINTKILCNNFEEVEIDFDKVYCKIRNKKSWLRKYPTYKKQIKEAYETDIDIAEYIKWLRHNRGINLKPVIENGIVKQRILTDDRILDYVNTALKVNYKNLWFTISKEGRFYNTLTNMSYTALPFIKLKTKEIMEVDVKNCQPLLLASIIDNEMYRADVEAGVFYDRVAEEIGKTRNEFKTLSFQFIFFANRKLKSGRIYNALNKLYPGFVEQINKLRDEIHISRKLQELEADIMVNKIGRLNYKMMLRHDAVFVFEEDYDVICEQVKAEFAKLGLKVQIK
ncbi:hypothetical protein LB456_05955 [Psychroflexus sp. CAK57W]|uniref:hypothetical protein n=1 Tax=Psychroflexus curvus TaxID=2873595 RepID=UPI001CCECED8|nr:hypothetical protein [Psychroflexus curvus]MBZ9786998.1 hypothetical protein [Psychroflexus curvus]